MIGDRRDAGPHSEMSALWMPLSATARAVAMRVADLAFFWMLNADLLRAASIFRTLEFICGEFHPDRLLNLALIQTAQTEGVQFLDPMSRAHTIVYQFPYYWFVGLAASLFGTGPAAPTVVLTMAARIGLVVAMYLVARRLGFGAVGARLVAAMTVLFGSLEYFLSGHSNFSNYGGHAVILPVFRQYYGAYTDSVSVTLGQLTLAAMLGALLPGAAARPPGAKVLVLVLLGTAAASLVHLLPAIYLGLTGFMMIFASALATAWRRRSVQAVFGGFVILYAAALVRWGSEVPIWALGLLGVLLACLCVAITDASGRRLFATFALGFAPTFGLLAYNFLLFRERHPSVHTYHDTVRRADLTIPPATLAFAFAPVLILAVGLVCTARSRPLRWIAGGVLTASVICMLNAHFGYNNHPYRFIPYAMPLLIVFALKGLVDLWAWQPRRAFAAEVRVVTIAVALLGLAAGCYANRLTYRNHLNSPHALAHRAFDSTWVAVARAIDAARGNAHGAFFVDKAVTNHLEVAALTAAPLIAVSPLYPAAGELQVCVTRLQEALDAGDSARFTAVATTPEPPCDRAVDFAVVAVSRPPLPGWRPVVTDSRFVVWARNAPVSDRSIEG